MSRTYEEKRDFTKTPEPRSGAKPQEDRPLTFVIQRHDASHLHFDFRLECDGALKSWAVPKGPSMDPSVKRAAIMVEDHPLEYANFEGRIPKGQYGGGEVILWDEGTYTPEDGNGDRQHDQKLVLDGLEAGKLSFVLNGSRLRGGFALIRMRDGKNWLLIKHHDDFDTSTDVTEETTSVRTGRTVEDLRGETHEPPLAHPGMMLPTEVEKAFDDEDWTFEPKLDGVRAMAVKKGGSVQLITRNDLDIANRFPDVAADIRQLEPETLILDGELILLDEEGKPDFQGLMDVYHGEEPNGGRLWYFAFDILRLEQKDLAKSRFTARRKALEGLSLKGSVRLVETLATTGIALYNQARQLGFEGIVGKRLDSPYVPGRTDKWVKIKGYHSEEFLVGGFTKGTGARAGTFGALLLGRKEEGRGLRYHGNVGGGFSDDMLREIKARLEPLIVKESPFLPGEDIPGKPTFVKPELLAEVRFMTWTRDNRLRFPIFLRLREDLMATPQSIVEKLPLKGDLSNGKEEVSLWADGHEIAFTHLSKELWPGISKRDFVEYLTSVADTYLNYLRDRPLTFVRYPDGIEGEGFFQRHWDHSLPDFVETVEIFSKSNGGTRRHLMCNNLATLLWLGQMSAIELHPWHSRATGKGFETDFRTLDKLESSALEYPDYLVCDLDPNIRSGKEAEGAEPELNEEGWRRTVEVALGLKEMLDALRMHSYVKTTGKTGLHIYIPLERRYESDQVKEAAKVLGAHLMARMEGKITMETRLNKRPNLVFFDANMNGRSRTLASAYSPRPVVGGRVSMPLPWEKLEKSHPEDFTIKTVPKLLSKDGDAWAGFFEDPQKLGE